MLPSSIEHLSENSELSMRYCKNLESLPNSLCNGPNLSYLHLSGSPGVEKMLENVLSSSSSPSGLLSLKRLALSECNMEVLPSALSRLSSLYRLNLRGNEFESLNLELVPSLRSLDISYCKRLKCLQASPRLDCLFASNCTSLETLPDINASFLREKCFYYYYNCFKLDESTRVKIQADARLRTKIMDPDPLSVFEVNYLTTKESFYERGSAIFCFPGSEISYWFINRNQRSSIEIDLPPHRYSYKFVVFVMCIVASCESSN
ncbi:hypothetical protein LWI28_010153 [Acer negundo]|uniref:C-JID domain-containing protein n=1 Tax=Acer negundo TaxID=4023 RepID=A0AAD5IQM2_ACENE|nr:hypothetical protein LWI28_010153 [Acer negundo]